MKLEMTSIPQPGEISHNVTILQRALNDKGASPALKVDGEFGPKTRTATSIFQKSMGFAGTGIPGEKTVAALGIIISGQTTGAPDVPVTSVGTITRQTVADKILSIIQKDVTDKLRETEGKNRSARIDSFNQRAKSTLGAPYCAAGGWCAIDDACKELGLKNPVPPTGSSQDFRRSSFVPAKYIRPEGSLGLKGDVGVLQSVGDAAHGHYTTVLEDQVAQPEFRTAEYNTDAILGDGDGDGAYDMIRSTVDRSKRNSGKIFVCFTDIPQWILDANKT